MHLNIFIVYSHFISNTRINPLHNDEMMNIESTKLKAFAYAKINVLS